MGDYVLPALHRLPSRKRGLLLPKAPLRLGAMISSAGRQRERTPAYDWHGLRRGRAQFVLFQHTLAGRGQLTWEGREHTIEPGQTMLLHLPHDHRYRVPAQGRWDFFYLCLHGSEVLRIWRSAAQRLGPVAVLPDEVVEAAAAACLAVLRGKVSTPGQASALAYDLTARLLDAAWPPHDASPAGRDPAIAAAIDFCQHHLDRPLGVGDLAAAAGYSRWHFVRRFRQSEGIPPSEFIQREKMKRAAHLLECSGLAVRQVAARCGFHDPNYFAKAFRRAYGLAPSEFRQAREPNHAAVGKHTLPSG